MREQALLSLICAVIAMFAVGMGVRTTIRTRKTRTEARQAILIPTSTTSSPATTARSSTRSPPAPPASSPATTVKETSAQAGSTTATPTTYWP